MNSNMMKTETLWNKYILKLSLMDFELNEDNKNKSSFNDTISFLKLSI